MYVCGQRRPSPAQVVSQSDQRFHRLHKGCMTLGFPYRKTLGFCHSEQAHEDLYLVEEAPKVDFLVGRLTDHTVSGTVTMSITDITLIHEPCVTIPFIKTCFCHEILWNQARCDTCLQINHLQDFVVILIGTFLQEGEFHFPHCVCLPFEIGTTLKIFDLRGRKGIKV